MKAALVGYRWRCKVAPRGKGEKERLMQRSPRARRTRRVRLSNMMSAPKFLIKMATALEVGDVSRCF